MTRGAELQRIAREGKRIRTLHLDVRAATSPLASSPGRRLRIGFVVPRFKHSAVDRNRLKRRLRELSRLRLLPTGLVADVVVRIRPDAYEASFEALARDIAVVRAQLQRWRPPADEASMTLDGKHDTDRGPTP